MIIKGVSARCCRPGGASICVAVRATNRMTVRMCAVRLLLASGGHIVRLVAGETRQGASEGDRRHSFACVACARAVRERESPAGAWCRWAVELFGIRTGATRVGAPRGQYSATTARIGRRLRARRAHLVVHRCRRSAVAVLLLPSPSPFLPGCFPLRRRLDSSTRQSTGQPPSPDAHRPFLIVPLDAIVPFHPASLCPVGSLSSRCFLFSPSITAAPASHRRNAD